MRKDKYVNIRFLDKKLRLHPILIIIGNWIFQGQKYMGFYENSLKILIDIFLTFLVNNASPYKNIFFSFLISRTINFFFNGQFFVTMRYVKPVFKKEKDFYEFVEIIKKKAINNKSINQVLIYGSFCTGKLNSMSDLDVRVVNNSNHIDGFLGAMFCLQLRLIAFFLKFPLDIYSTTKKSFLEKLNENEIPLKIIG